MLESGLNKQWLHTHELKVRNLSRSYPLFSILSVISPLELAVLCTYTGRYKVGINTDSVVPEVDGRCLLMLDNV